MADVLHFRIGVFEAEVATDGSRWGDGGVGGAEEIADAGDDVLTLEGEGDDGRFLHEFADGGEEGLIGDVGVVLGEDLIAEGHHFDAADGEAFFLEAGEDFSGEVLGDCVGFEEDEGRFLSHAVGCRRRGLGVQAF